MGMAKSLADSVQELVKVGYYRFVATFTWTGLEDNVALERFTPYIGHKKLDEFGIDSGTSQFYFLTGKRTVLVIAYTKSGASLQRFVASVIFGADIKAEVYHAVEGYEIAEASRK